MEVIVNQLCFRQLLSIRKCFRRPFFGTKNDRKNNNKNVNINNDKKAGKNNSKNDSENYTKNDNKNDNENLTQRKRNGSERRVGQ